MTEQDHLATGRDVWNQWRRENQSIQPDFSGVGFRGAQLSRVNLAGAHLNGVDFSDADLTGIDFSKANTHGAWLGKAYISGCSETSGQAACRL